jgi:flagellar biosynthesis/type III secretory pathway protein FliH
MELPPLGTPKEPRFDTLVEDLVPRAEEEALTAISEAVKSFQHERQQALADAEQELVELVKVICRRVLLGELTQNPRIVERLVRGGLEALGGGDRVTVKLGPFFEEVANHVQDGLTQQGIKSVVVIDPSVGAQGCQLSTELGRVDESVERRLDVLLAALDLSGKSDSERLSAPPRTEHR